MKKDLGHLKLKIIFSIIGLVACSKAPIQDPDVSILRSRIDYLEERIAELERLEFERDRSYARFSPDSSGFARVDSEISSFLLMLGKIQPYADGYKVTLNLGNPNFATYANIVLNVCWGKRFDSNKMTYIEWKKNEKCKKIDIPREVNPGSWNPTDIVLAPASSEEVGSIKISLDTPNISLRRK